MLPTNTTYFSGNGWYDTVLFPFKWITSWLVVGIHKLLTIIGFPTGPGITWVLTIVLLTVFVRVCILPLYIKQIRSARGTAMIAPKMQEIRNKYKGRTDPVSKQQMSQETMGLYREYGVNPMASCLPLLVQLPVFAGLYRLLYQISFIKDQPELAIGGIDGDLAHQMDTSQIFGLNLSDSFQSNPNSHTFIIIFTIVYAGLMFLQQFLMAKYNMDPKNEQQARMMKIMMWIFPIMMVPVGFVMQVGLLIYMVTTMIISFAQQVFVLLVLPTPGSRAHDYMMKRNRAKFAEYEKEQQALLERELFELDADMTDVAKAQKLVLKAKAKGSDEDPFANHEDGEKLRQALEIYNRIQGNIRTRAQDLELEPKPVKPRKQGRFAKMMEEQQQKQMGKSAPTAPSAGAAASGRNQAAQPKRTSRAQRVNTPVELTPEELERRRQARRQKAGKPAKNNKNGKNKR